MTASPAAGLPTDELAARLLTRVADTGRQLFGAAACSITRLDEDADLLVFEAVAGEGAQRLVGSTFPAATGLAGWAIAAQEPIVVDDLGSDERHAREVAERSGYLPRTILTAPLLDGDDAIGTMQVLDRDRELWSSADAVELLGALAEHAGAALALVLRVRRAQAVAAGDTDLAVLARVAATAGANASAHPDLIAALAEVLG